MLIIVIIIIIMPAIIAICNIHKKPYRTSLNETAIEIHQTLFQKTPQNTKGKKAVWAHRHLNYDTLGVTHTYLIACYLMQGFLSHTWTV